MSRHLTDRPENTPLGVAIILLTVLAMSFADAVVKYASSSLPLWQIYVTRSLIVIPGLVALAMLGPRAVDIRPKSSGWVYLRGFLLALMYLAIYAAIPLLSLSVIAASLYTAPLFIALLSAPVIGERVGLWRWIAICIGFAGVLVILRPATDGFSTLALIPVAAALLYALAAVITRTKCTAELPAAMALGLNFCLLAVGAIATLIIAIWQPSPSQSAVYPFLLGPWIVMGPREWEIVLLLAALMIVISIGLAKAYQSAPPTVIATFDYAYLAFAAFWGFVVFSEVPDTPTILGILMIAGAGFLVTARRTGSLSSG